MANTATSYKNPRTRRVINVPNSFQLGCNFVEQEELPGYAKFLLNYEYTDDGYTLVPREGYKIETTLHSGKISENPIGTGLGDAHFDGLFYVHTREGKDILMEAVISLGQFILHGAPEVGIPEEWYYHPYVSFFGPHADTSAWTLLMSLKHPEQFSFGDYYKAAPTVADADWCLGFVKAKTFHNFSFFGIKPIQYIPGAPVACAHMGFVYTICTGGTLPKGDTWQIECSDPTFKLARVKLVEQEEMDNQFSMRREVVEKYKPSIPEAMSVGFNMLLDNPYTFDNRQGAPEVYGVMAYKIPTEPGKTFGDVLFTANRGEAVRFNCVYGFESGSQYEIKWEAKGATEEQWTVLKDWTAFTAGVTNYAYIDYTPIHEATTIQASIRKKGDNADVQIGTLPRFRVDVKELNNLGAEKFDLTTATGMFSYNHMLGLYGVDGAESSLFFSDIENPGYFPFPHNTDTFDNAILSVTNYLDSLLVVTDSNMYLITGTGLPNTFVKRKVMENINLTEYDARQIKVIKDQVFFKADNKFYVFTPNTYSGDATDIRAFEISKTINPLLQDFEFNILKIYNEAYPLSLLHHAEGVTGPKAARDHYTECHLSQYDTTIMDGKLHIRVYLELVHAEEIGQYTYLTTFSMVYDPLIRRWTFEAADLGSFNGLVHRRISTGEYFTFGNMVDATDRYLVVRKKTRDPEDEHTYNALYNTYHGLITFPNWQLLDTGVLPLDTAHYKRLRELQFTVVNKAKQRLHMCTEVLVDGKNVVDSTSYNIEHDTDPESENYGHIYVEAVDTPNLNFISNTYLDGWELDNSKFPDLDLMRVHMLLYGKGRFISGVFINRDQKEYKISDVLWVYRTMNSR